MPRTTDRQAFVQYLASARQAEWVVYAKPPFAGRYTHRVAIANTRLLDMEARQVRFRYQDYRDRDPRQKTMTLPADEFMRRFLLHVLPARFQRIRHYGLLGNRHRHEKLARCRHLLGSAAPEPPASASASTSPHADRDRSEALTGRSLRTCPVCRATPPRVLSPVTESGRACPHTIRRSWPQPMQSPSRYPVAVSCHPFLAHQHGEPTLRHSPGRLAPRRCAKNALYYVGVALT